MGSDIYQHYRPSEKEFIDKALGWVRKVEDKQMSHLTYFLNPRESEILAQLAQASDLQVKSAPEAAELQKMIVVPAYYEVNSSDFSLSLIEISFPHKFGQLSHWQILGSLLAETGLERREIGDILVSDEKAQFYCSRQLVEHFLSSVKKMGSLTVKLQEVSLEKVISVPNEAKNSVILVSSLRLDKIIAASLNISRNLALNMVQSGQIKVNYSEITKADFLLTEGDMLSIRGYGRLKLSQLLGFTKKDKMKIEISTLLSRK